MTRDERQEAIRVKWIESGCRGILVACTGFGKTRVAVNCVRSMVRAYPDKSVIVVVPTVTLRNQWEDTLRDTGIASNCEVLVMNTAARKDRRCDLLVVDECHRICARTLSAILGRTSFRYILGLTATLERLDGRHDVILRHCKVIDTVTLKEAEENGWVSGYREYRVLIDVDDIGKYEDMNREFTKYFEFFNFDWNLVTSMLGPNGFNNRLRLCDMMTAGRDVPKAERTRLLRSISVNAVQFMRVVQARKAFIANHPRKVEIARRIIDARPGRKVIVFSGSVDMASSIGRDAVVYAGRSSSAKARKVLEAFNAMDGGVLSSCMKANEGLDIPDLSVAIMLCVDSSKVKRVQRIGRVVRKGEDKDVEVFTVVINNTVETRWCENSDVSDDVVQIDEKGLDDVLNGRKPRELKRKASRKAFGI